MNISRLKALLGATALTIVAAGAAQAGGFSRGTADTDILYEEGNFNMRAGVTYVNPTREYTRNGNPALVGTSYTDSYAIPSAAVKFNIMSNLRCAGTIVENNGGSARYAFPTASGKILEEFDTTETALTCGMNFEVGKGRLWVLGGGFMEKFDYDRQNFYGPLGNATLNLSGQEFGYRVGVAYDIPEIALRGQIMYRSGTDYGADGMLRAPAGVLCLATGIPGFCLAPPATQIPVPALGIGSLPQSLDVKFQTGVAPGWLAFGAVKWTDWTATTTLDVRAAATGTQITSDKYFWKDGWTVTGGVGHAFTDQISGLASITWDRGVSTGWDLSSDTWTLGLGASAKDKLGGEIRGGVGLTYISAAAETKYGPNPNITDGTDSAVKAGYAFAFNLGYSIKW